MASASDVKGFYRQKKKTGAGRGIGNSKANKATSFKKPKNSASVGTDQVQPPAIISHGSLDLQEEFDIGMSYGPCFGMTRLDRWEHAKALGLKPPKDVECLLRAGKGNAECLWAGHI